MVFNCQRQTGLRCSCPIVIEGGRVDKIIIEGGLPLYGEVVVSGAKNAALPLIASTLLVPGQHAIGNVPDLRDTRTILALLREMGAVCERQGESLLIDTADIRSVEASYELVKTMRASVLVLGPLLARFGRARVSLPGGCAIGARPIDLHLKALQKMGAEIVLEEGYVDATADNGLHGAEIYLDIPSVTGTENILMAAVGADGTTIINNAAREPEIANLIDMLTAMGGRIDGRNSDQLTVHGVSSLHAAQVETIPDRIEAGTYMLAAAATGGELLVKKCRPRHFSALIEKLRDAELDIEEGKDSIRVRRTGKLSSVDITTHPYPGFATDLQAQMMALMAITPGVSVISETIFENRFMHVAELKRMGADIRIDGHSAVVNGSRVLNGAPVMATDLRASASLVIAGLAAHGTTQISRIYHLERGYEKLVEKLSAVGARIKRVAEKQ